MLHKGSRTLSRLVLCASLFATENCVARTETDASAEDTAPDTTALDAGVCHTSTDCPSGYACSFAIGCGVEGHCTMLDVPCDAVDIQMQYCTCEGNTLVGRPGDCPGSAVAWAHGGPCVTDASSDAGD